MSSVATMSAISAKRMSCYLCDLPRMQWAMILDFSGKINRSPLIIQYQKPDLELTHLNSLSQLALNYCRVIIDKAKVL